MCEMRRQLMHFQKCVTKLEENYIYDLCIEMGKKWQLPKKVSRNNCLLNPVVEMYPTNFIERITPNFQAQQEPFIKFSMNSQVLLFTCYILESKDPRRHKKVFWVPDIGQLELQQPLDFSVGRSKPLPNLSPLMRVQFQDHIKQVLFYG